MTPDEYIKRKNEFLDKLDEEFCGLSRNDKDLITTSLKTGLVDDVENELAKYPRCVDFVIRAEHQLLILKRKKK